MSEHSIFPKEKASKMNWKKIDDLDCVTKEGWQNEPQTPWTCTTCKKHVKLTHFDEIVA